MTKGCIYYTDLRPKKFILDTCQAQLKKACPYKIVSVSLHEPIGLGENICITDRERSYPTMLYQIVLALEKLDTDIVFFLEHDVLYHSSHFDFTPPTDYIYYYNLHNYRWGIKETYAITYDGHVHERALADEQAKGVTEQETQTLIGKRLKALQINRQRMNA